MLGLMLPGSASAQTTDEWGPEPVMVPTKQIIGAPDDLRVSPESCIALNPPAGCDPSPKPGIYLAETPASAADATNLLDDVAERLDTVCGAATTPDVSCREALADIGDGFGTRRCTAIDCPGGYADQIKEVVNDLAGGLVCEGDKTYIEVFCTAENIEAFVNSLIPDCEDCQPVPTEDEILATLLGVAEYLQGEVERAAEQECPDQECTDPSQMGLDGYLDDPTAPVTDELNDGDGDGLPGDAEYKCRVEAFPPKLLVNKPWPETQPAARDLWGNPPPGPNPDGKIYTVATGKQSACFGTRGHGIDVTLQARRGDGSWSNLKVLSNYHGGSPSDSTDMAHPWQLCTHTGARTYRTDMVAYYMMNNKPDRVKPKKSTASTLTCKRPHELPGS